MWPRLEAPSDAKRGHHPDYHHSVHYYPCFGQYIPIMLHRPPCLIAIYKSLKINVIGAISFRLVIFYGVEQPRI
jgi:hypothetical protein